MCILRLYTNWVIIRLYTYLGNKAVVKREGGGVTVYKWREYAVHRWVEGMKLYISRGYNTVYQRGNIRLLGVNGQAEDVESQA